MPLFGTFVDYIQEIGRAARDKNISGVAAKDFNERDFYYMKRLHSAGAISHEQLGLSLIHISNKEYECWLSVAWEVISPFKRKIN